MVEEFSSVQHAFIFNGAGKNGYKRRRGQNPEKEGEVGNGDDQKEERCPSGQWGGGGGFGGGGWGTGGGGCFFIGIVCVGWGWGWSGWFGL